MNAVPPGVGLEHLPTTEDRPVGTVHVHHLTRSTPKPNITKARNKKKSVVWQ